MGPKEAIRLDGSSASSTAGSSHNGEAEMDHNSDNGVLSKSGENEISDDDEDGVKCIKCEKVFLDIFT